MNAVYFKRADDAGYRYKGFTDISHHKLCKINSKTLKIKLDLQNIKFNNILLFSTRGRISFKENIRHKILYFVLFYVRFTILTRRLSIAQKIAKS